MYTRSIHCRSGIPRLINSHDNSAKDVYAYNFVSHQKGAAQPIQLGLIFIRTAESLSMTSDLNLYWNNEIKPLFWFTKWNYCISD